MKQLILKTKLRGRDEFETKLDKAGFDLSPIFWQHDRIYLPRGYKRGANFPRLILRTEMRAVDRPAKYSLIMRRHLEGSGVDFFAESKIDDYKSVAEMLLQLGFELSSEVSRKRQEVKISKTEVLYLDKVEDLPNYYCKLERELSSTDKPEFAREDLEHFMANLNETAFTRQTYAELLAK